MENLKPTSTGAGSFGDVQPGWEVEEHITPVAPGDAAGGTGRVSFSAKANDEAELLVNNPITTEVGDLGTISGTIRNVSVDGSTVTVTHDTVLSKFNAERYFPPLAVGSGRSAIDLATQLLGEIRLNPEAFLG